MNPNNCYVSNISPIYNEIIQVLVLFSPIHESTLFLAGGKVSMYLL